MRKTMTGVTSKEFRSLLSEMGYMVYAFNDFWIWVDTDTGLYSLSLGYNNRNWLLCDVPVEKLDAWLRDVCPFWNETETEGGVEAEECIQ